MYLSHLFSYYMVGRVLFALALAIPFQITGAFGTLPQLLPVLGIYAGIAIVRLILSFRKVNTFDFVLDIVFVTAIVSVSGLVYSYISLVYLFPLFFSSLLISTRWIFFFPLLGIVLYGTLYSALTVRVFPEGSVNIALHGISFFLIAIAGNHVKERIEKQNEYIKRLEEERITMEGLARLYRVSADLAHELRNPLASVSAAAQFLAEGNRDPELITMLNIETQRLTSLVNDFLMYSRPADAPKECVDLFDVLTGAVGRITTEKKLELRGSHGDSINANRTFIETALLNIVRNATEAAVDRVHIILSKEYDDVTKHLSIVITIDDDGPGVPEEKRQTIFEPFFTTKKTGTGLGLAIANRIVSAFGGIIRVDRSPLGGARFIVRFPLNE